MNEDGNSMTASMARDALAGVNGGASALTPEPAPKGGVDAAGSSGFGSDSLGRQAETAFGLAKRTVANLSRGFRGTALGRFGLNAGGGQPAQPLQRQTGAQNAPGLVSALLGGQSAPPAPAAPAQPQIGMRPMSERLAPLRPIGGGAAIPHYDYNGVSVALPYGVDVNDANAVGAAMAEQNAIIDMMNAMNDEED